jgi:hypothetical protein
MKGDEDRQKFLWMLGGACHFPATVGSHGATMAAPLGGRKGGPSPITPRRD